MQYRIFTSIGKLNIDVPESMRKSDTGERYFICPICTPKRQPKNQSQKKLAVNTENMKWRCNHCQEAGNLYTEKDLNDAIKPLNYSPNFKFLTDKIYDWFKKRGISKDTVDYFKVKKCYRKILQLNVREENQNDKNTWKLRSCIAFPLIDSGRLVNVQYRDPEKNFSMESGAEKICFNIDSIKMKDVKKVIITEGYVDCMSYHEVGFLNVVSIPNGTTITSREEEIFATTGKMMVERSLNLSFIDPHIDYFEKAEEIIIASDDDPAGIKFREEAARRFGKEKCRYTVFSRWKRPNGKPCKDGNDVLMHCGRKELVKTIEEAEFFPVQSITKIDDVWSTMQNNFGKPILKGLPLGFKELENHLTIHLGHTFAVNGFPGMGKTSFMLYFLVLMAVKYGWKSACYTPENYPLTLVYEQLIEIYIGKSAKVGATNMMTKVQYEKGKEFINKNIFLIDEDSKDKSFDGYTPASLFKVFSMAIKKYGIKICCFDPWNSLEHKRERHYNIDDYVKTTLSKINRFTQKNEVLTLIGVHPPTPEKSSTKMYNAPSVFEIEGGGAWAKKMYEVGCLHKPSDELGDTSVEFHVQKIKIHKTTGVPTPRDSPAILHFKRVNNRFTDPDGYDPLDEALKDKVQQINLEF